MIVVSDASPINILVRIGHSGILHQLFGRVLIPPAVASELSHPNTPESVKSWLAAKPDWLEIRAPAQIDSMLGIADAGEMEAISLALEVHADLMLIDDKKARRVAKERGIKTTGAIGVLELAASRRLIVLSAAIEKIRSTNFGVADHILDAALARHPDRPRP